MGCTLIYDLKAQFIIVNFSVSIILKYTRSLSLKRRPNKTCETIGIGNRGTCAVAVVVVSWVQALVAVNSVYAICIYQRGARGGRGGGGYRGGEDGR